LLSISPAKGLVVFGVDEVVAFVLEVVVEVPNLIGLSCFHVLSLAGVLLRFPKILLVPLLKKLPLLGSVFSFSSDGICRMGSPLLSLLIRSNKLGTEVPKDDVALRGST